MAPYLFLLCLSISLEYSLSYDYIRGVNNFEHNYGQHSFQKRSHRRKNRHQTKHNVANSHPEYDIADGKEPTAQIDVDSFIRKPDEYAVEENPPYETISKKSEYKTYQDYGSPLFKLDSPEYMKFSDNQMDSNAAADEKISKLHPNVFLFDEPSDARNEKFKAMPEHRREQKKYVRNLEASNNRIHSSGLSGIHSGASHNPKRKSSSQYLKIPFFFRSKNETQKLKKNKKRKVFCFNCPKKDNKIISSSTNTVPQNIPKETEKTKQQQIKTVPNKKMVDDYLSPVKISRVKREDWDANKERQLKEIEEIQKKIDDVEITSTGT